MKRFLQFLIEKSEPDETWHHLDHTNPSHAKVIEAFRNLADAQRGNPESAMLKVTRTAGGGVLSPAVEHIGDLTHRMSEHAKYGSFGQDAVVEKVNRGIRALTYPYGFEKEHNENMISNARGYNTPHSITGGEYRGPDYTPEKHHAAVNSALKAYSDEHAKLPVYNKAQFHAREAAISLGHKSFDIATMHLQKLDNMIKSKEGWNHHASKFRFGPDGSPREYKIGDE